MLARKHTYITGFAEVSNPVCWTRIQTEAGQGLERILARKEIERRSNDGVFFWGVGNAPSRAISALAYSNSDIDVVFSIMKTRPKIQDVAPEEVWLWRAFYGNDGRIRPLPPGSVITSRGNSAGGNKRAHYALVCQSTEPLDLRDHGGFDPAAFRNIAETGGPVGNSQVTALLRRVSDDHEADYRINLRAKLVGDLWVRLADPVRLTAQQADAISFHPGMTIKEWKRLSSELRHVAPDSSGSSQLVLF